jgi:phosphatidylserine decarboxylase
MGALFVRLQYLLPQHLLSRIAYAVTRSRIRWLKNALIAAFMRAYRPRMTDALDPEPLHYASFNAFFTRALRPQARALDPDPLSILCPCDGSLSVASAMQSDELLQAKGHRYSLEALLADEHWADTLRGGLYATLYLAPFNYHRVHMPLAGRLRAAWHVAGRLFSVNRATVERVPGLFARNERIVCAFDGEHGAFVVVLVGALFVGSMSTVWHGEITPWRKAAHSAEGRSLAGRRAAGGAGGVHRLEPHSAAAAWQPRGAELGLFNMGSTVLLLLPPGLARWDPGLESGASVAVGQALGSLLLPARA